MVFYDTFISTRRCFYFGIKMKKKETSKLEKKKDVKVETKKVKSSKKKGENIFKKIGNYFKGVLKELKRIKWTTKKDLVKYSIASVCFVLSFSLYFYIVELLAVFLRSLV